MRRRWNWRSGSRARSGSGWRRCSGGSRHEAAAAVCSDRRGGSVRRGGCRFRCRARWVFAGDPSGRPAGRARDAACAGVQRAGLRAAGRSEEHTSELQSLMRISYAVFCLKKKNTYNYTTSLLDVILPQTAFSLTKHQCPPIDHKTSAPKATFHKTSHQSQLIPTKTHYIINNIKKQTTHINHTSLMT